MSQPSQVSGSTPRAAALAAFCALIVLGLSWEMWLAPLRPGGSALALKVLPLLFALPSISRGSVRAYQWWSMGILAYVCEGAVRAASDRGMSATLGIAEVLIALFGFAAILLYVRARRTHE